MTTTATRRKPVSKKATTVAIDTNDLNGSNWKMKSVDKLQGMLIDIPLESIDPHPDNRKITEESVAELAEAIKEFGQLEPATVRAIDAGGNVRYELLSGERRFRACQVGSIPTLRCVIVNESDDVALVRLAAANFHRRDLNPIERAVVIEQLMRPVDKGGSGLDRAAAGRAVGLHSESGVKNALRIMKLPKSIRDEIIAGNISERAARRLVPFVELKSAMEQIAKELVGPMVRDGCYS